MTEREDYLVLPWSVDDTIENLKIVKENLQRMVRRENLHGKGRTDEKEVAFDFDRAIEALEEIQQYRAIGTVEECREAVERMEPKKPKLVGEGVYDEDSGDWMYDRDFEICPTCKRRNEVFRGWSHCHYCGQALDWNESEGD